jgi:hypothetical protein
MHSKHPFSFTKCVHGTERRNFPREAPHLICPKFYAFTCYYCKASSAKRCQLQRLIKLNELPDSSNRSPPPHRTHIRLHRHHKNLR